MNLDEAGTAGPDEMPACGPDDLSVTVRWERHGAGLRGEVIAENTGDRACRLPVETLITLEWLSPGFVTLEPGERAAAALAWDGWGGQAASSRAQVTWEGGAATATVDGPAQPDATAAPGNISSSWFRLLR